MPQRLVIKNGHVMTLDEMIGDFQQADILVEGSKIIEVAENIPTEGSDIVDAADMIVMPGLVDAHRHLWHAQLRGLAVDMTLVQFFAEIPGRFGSLYRPEDMYAGTFLGALEALNAGVTTTLDWSNILHTPEHAAAAVRALQDAGTRAVFTYGMPQDTSFHEDDVRRLREQSFPGGGALLSLAIGTLSPEHAPLDVAKRDIQLARELNIICSMHTGGGGTHGGVTQLAEAGLLGPDLNFAHCNTLHDDEYRLIAESGGSVTVTPEVEMQMGLGMPATRKVLEHGFRPSLGVDVVTAASGDLFAQMRFALQCSRAQTNEEHLEKGDTPPSPDVTARDVIAFATIEGARALGLEKDVGSITPGKEADIVLLRTSDLNLHPANSPEAAVLHAHAANVDSVFVSGKALKRHGRLTHVDLDRARRIARQSRDALYEKVN